MVVYIGDASAHGFTNSSEPFTVPPNANGLWNSLFIKNAATVTALSTTTIGGVGGVWAIDGHLVYPGLVPSPTIQSVRGVGGGPVASVAPGQLVSILTAGLAPVDLQPGAAAVTVWFDGVASPAISVAGSKISAMVPYGITNSADAVVGYDGQQTPPFPLALKPTSPVAAASGIIP
jgi:hypothetical protein